MSGELPVALWSHGLNLDWKPDLPRTSGVCSPMAVIQCTQMFVRSATASLTGLLFKLKQNKTKQKTEQKKKLNFRKQLRKSPTKFFFFCGCFFPTWVFDYVKINEIFVLCFNWFHIESKSVELKAWAQRMVTTSIIFLITSDDKPNSQRYAHYAMYAGHSNCLWLNWINCWSVPPFSWKVPWLQEGYF